VSWIPTLRIARAAWKGRQDPAGLIKSQLTDQPAPAEAQAPLPAPGAPALAPAALPEPEPVVQRHEDPTHAHLLLLLR